MEHAPLKLKPREERRLRGGHLWVFSNEVDTATTPLTDLEPGQPVVIQASNGKPLGAGYANPHSLICARLVSRDADKGLDRSLLVHRLKVALSARQAMFERPYYRLVHGEGDFLPGLVVDRYDDVCVVQMGTAGMERAREAILEALEKVIRPRVVILRNDAAVREQEGLERYTETAVGSAPETLTVEEGGMTFRVPGVGGQKTGWFFDHRENRDRFAAWSHGRRVLDVYSYVGGFGLRAAAAGAEEVVAIERSEEALDHLQDNAEVAGLEDRVAPLHGEALEVLKALREDGERFDAVVLDPPAFIKRKRDIKSGLEGYRHLNQLALQLLSKDGLLLSASCSHHLGMDQLQDTVRGRARHLDRDAAVLARGHQGPDHPIHPAIPETEYLKAVFARILPTQ